MHVSPSALMGFSTYQLLCFQHELDCLWVRVSQKTKQKKDLVLFSESQMAKAMVLAWSSAAKKAIDEVVLIHTRTPFTDEQQGVFLTALSSALQGVFSKDEFAQLRIAIHLRSVWNESQKELQTVSKQQSIEKAGEREISLLQKAQNFWLNNFYNSHLAERVKSVVGAVASKTKEGLLQLRDALRSALYQETGVAPATSVPTAPRPQPSVLAPEKPAKYAGKPQDYFDLVAATTAHQTRIFAQLQAAQMWGVQTYQLENPNDDRTTEICQVLHGYQFSTQAGLSQMEKILEVQGEKIKAVSPWLSADQIEKILEGVQAKSQEAAARLTSAGVLLPPFHPRCRTDVVLVGET